MKRRTQFLFSATVLIVAITLAVAYSARPADQAGPTGAAGHDHGASGGADASNPVVFDSTGARRIGVTYATVVNKSVERVVETVGSVTYDETRLVEVNPKVEGWIERLFVDFTGAPVTRGQPLLSIYSPMLVSAQEELILASRLVASSAATGGRSSRNAEDLLDAARRRLRYWDVPEDEIERIEREGAPRKALILRAPASGIVVEKNIVEGGRITPGMSVYGIADLSRVWVEGEVFEKDLAMVRLGQRARVSLDAYAGESFDGVVTYVYPTVSTDTRTGRMRIELANPGLRLKPGMYARVQLLSPQGRRALVIPRGAVHWTGERALVFLRDANGMLQPREIHAGLATGDEVEVLAGLAEGDVVVSSANFLIDAESNMSSAMQSMPSVDSSGAPQSESKSGPHAGHDDAGTPRRGPGAGHGGH
jgi:Cu(I)/Ag(I) efflux system membrane fusion protein